MVTERSVFKGEIAHETLVFIGNDCGLIANV